MRDILALKGHFPATVGQEEYERQRKAYANGMGGPAIVGDPIMSPKRWLTSAGPACAVSEFRW